MSDACSLLTAGLQYAGRESPTLLPSASLSFGDMGGGAGQAGQGIRQISRKRSRRTQGPGVEGQRVERGGAGVGPKQHGSGTTHRPSQNQVQGRKESGMSLPTGSAGHPVSSSSNTAPSAPYPGAPRGSRPRLQKSARLVGVKCYLTVV